MIFVIKPFLLAAGLALGFGASASAATVVDFQNGNNGSNGLYDGTYSVTIDGLTVFVTAGRYSSSGGPDTIIDSDCSDGGCGTLGDREVRKSNSGLGVDDPAGFPNTDGGDIDGFLGNDLITFTFNTIVNFDEVFFRNVDSNDDFDIFIDGLLVSEDVGIAGSNPFDLSTFIPSSGMSISFGADGSFDNYRVGSLTVAAVPIPAAGLLLLTGLGGLAAMQRRRKKLA